MVRVTRCIRSSSWWTLRRVSPVAFSITRNSNSPVRVRRSPGLVLRLPRSSSRPPGAPAVRTVDELCEVSDEIGAHLGVAVGRSGLWQMTNRWVPRGRSRPTRPTLDDHTRPTGPALVIFGRPV